MVSLPGSEAQKVHTDIPPDLDGDLWTSWVALQVGGMIYMFPGVL
jgi:hypothetical protein